MRHHERAQFALAAFADRAGRTRRLRRQQVQHALVFLHDHGALAHRLGGEQVELFQPPVAVRQDIDRLRQRGEIEGRIVEGVQHDQAP